MSERKVLNKYYPPDYDPSKIPRTKERRNATFIIRVMAPCNMRCTTCGEYIYKGRKFNARKEDVDDMNHLGLRIYRFYIKCTACVSEISFRTDPANTDYILEAGATRNFEALAKAEKQEEARIKAHEAELQDNPMKLLEERTEASKREMDRLEALEELHEINKRNVNFDIDKVISSVHPKSERAEEDPKDHTTLNDEDERIIREMFDRDHISGQSVKRLKDEQDSIKSSSSHVLPRKKSLIVGDKSEDWNRSVGGLNSSKSSLKNSILVKKKEMKPSKVESKAEEIVHKIKPSTSNPLNNDDNNMLVGDYGSSSSDNDSSS